MAMNFGNPRGRLRSRDTQVLIAATYDDGRTAYFRVPPSQADGGTATLMPLAQAAQRSGELPDGAITALKRVR